MKAHASLIAENDDGSKEFLSGKSHLLSNKPQNQNLAPKLFYKAAQKGNKEAVQQLKLLTRFWDFPIPYLACYYLGLVFQHGYGNQTINLAEAAKWYLTAATAFGVQYQPIKNLEELAQVEKERESKGQEPHSIIYTNLANCYLTLIHAPKECFPNEYVNQEKLLFEKALSLLRYAAELNDKHAMFKLGLVYEGGNSYCEFQANPVQALEWYRLCKDDLIEANERFTKLENSENARIQNKLKLWANRKGNHKPVEKLQAIDLSENLNAHRLS